MPFSFHPLVHRRALLAAALFTGATLAAPAAPARAQDPITGYSQAFEARFDRTQPVVRYTLHARPSTDSLGYAVDMSIRSVRDTLRLAIPLWAPGAYRVAAFHRYVKNVRITTADGEALPVVREDSSTWRAVVPVAARGREVTVRYDIRYPTAVGAAGLGNYSFFRSDGALISGPMTYLRIVGATLVPAHVTFDLPPTWRIVTGLVPTADPHTFFAPTYDVLIDCPTLIGSTLRLWTFAVDGVPHRIAYYPTAATVPFDTVRWVDMHQRIVAAARDVMGRLPYREYTFIYEDGPGGGLEHLNSATMSAPSATLARDAAGIASLTAHEYFHAWNIKRVRPVELGPFAYDRPVRTTSLWWAEGMTDFFSNELRRRSGIDDEAAALADLRVTLDQYLNNPGHDRVSPERASWTTWDPNTVNGGYNISYYVTGALLGEMLELHLRNATDGLKGVDDVERILFDRHAGAVGYTGENILNAVNEVCGCDMQPFFGRFVSGHESFDLAPYLAYAGYRLDTVRVRTDSLGRPLADTRASITGFNGVGSLGSYAGSPARLALSVPEGSFGRAGLRDGDFIVSVNGVAIATPADFRAAFARARVGDKYVIAYTRAGVAARTAVTILPYDRLTIRLSDLPAVTARQRAVRSAWLSGYDAAVWRRVRM